jgi:hypothetical protein
MTKKLAYRKKSGQFVIAVRLDLETSGFSYRKWGSDQRCRRGDWIVNNNGDIYTVADDTFKNTYTAIEAGRYEKTATVWAIVADRAGSIATKEGTTAYAEGDYLVFNDEHGEDGYAVSREKFESMYELCAKEH